MFFLVRVSEIASFNFCWWCGQRYKSRLPLFAASKYLELHDGWRQTTSVEVKFGSNWRRTISSCAPWCPAFLKVTSLSSLVPKSSLVSSLKIVLTTLGGEETFFRCFKRLLCHSRTVDDKDSPAEKLSKSNFKGWDSSVLFPILASRAPYRLSWFTFLTSTLVVLKSFAILKNSLSLALYDHSCK